MKLSKQNRQEDSIKALEDLEYRKKLYEEFGVYIEKVASMGEILWKLFKHVIEV